MTETMLEGLCIIWGAELCSLTVSLPFAALLLSGCALVLQLPCISNKIMHIADSSAGDATLARDHQGHELLTHVMLGQLLSFSCCKHTVMHSHFVAVTS